MSDGRRRLIVHAGMPKTGSTAIQNALAAAGQSDRALGRPYVHTGRWGTSHHLLAWWVRDPTDPRVDEAGLGGRKMGEALAAELNASDASRWVVSSEVLFHLPAPSLTRLVDCLEGENVEFRVLMYLRDPAEYVESWYRQRVQMTAYRKTVDAHMRDLRVQSYRARVSSFDSAFGVGQVEIRAYDRRSLLNGDAVADFAVWADIPELADQAVLARLANASVDPELLEFKRVLNTRLSDQTAARVGAALGDLSAARGYSKGFLLKPSQAEHVSRFILSGFDELARRHGMDVPVFGHQVERDYVAPQLSTERFCDLRDQLAAMRPDLAEQLAPTWTPDLGGDPR